MSYCLVNVSSVQMVWLCPSESRDRFPSRRLMGNAESHQSNPNRNSHDGQTSEHQTSQKWSPHRRPSPAHSNDKVDAPIELLTPHSYEESNRFLRQAIYAQISKDWSDEVRAANLTDDGAVGSGDSPGGLLATGPHRLGGGQLGVRWLRFARRFRVPPELAEEFSSLLEEWRRRTEAVEEGNHRGSVRRRPCF